MQNRERERMNKKENAIGENFTTAQYNSISKHTKYCKAVVSNFTENNLQKKDLLFVSDFLYCVLVTYQ